MDFIDIHQHKKISEAGSAAAQAGLKAEKSAENLRQLERKVEKLITINHALWELLKEAGQMSEEHLESRLAHIEAEHERNQGAAVCPKCNRVSAAKHTKCMYCGVELPKRSIFFQVRAS